MTDNSKLQLAKDCLAFYANGNNYLQPTIETTHKDGYICRAIPNAKTPIEREGWGRKAKECLASLNAPDYELTIAGIPVDITERTCSKRKGR